MKPHIINFGSINIDHVYRVDHFVRPGETLASNSLSTVLGGKGANQSVAITRAGGVVRHIGRVCAADQWVLTYLEVNGIDIAYVDRVKTPSGHAIIQVDRQGENCILLHGGANQDFDESTLNELLKAQHPGDYLLMQNETNGIARAFELAIEQGLRVVLNPAPMTDAIRALPLEKLDTLVVNLGEAQALTNCDEFDEVVDALANRLPDSRVVITLGENGAVLLRSGTTIRVAARPAKVVDTTAAGDTFVGYFLAGIVDGMSDQCALERACHAAALAVETLGAMPSIPKLERLEHS